MKKNIKGLCAIFLIAVSCGRNEEPRPATMPEINDVTVTEVRFHDAVFSARITGLIGEENSGFELSSQGKTDKKEYVVAPEEGLIQKKVSDLTADTEYSLRSFVDNGRNIRVFSDAVTFKTCQLPDPSQIVPIEDPVFKKWLLVRYDENCDGELSFREAQSVTNIEVCTDNIYSVNGIEYFTNLNSVNLSGGQDEHGNWNGKLKDADLSRNKALTMLIIDGNCLPSIDLSSLTELHHIGISRNPLKEVSFSSQRQTAIIGCSATDIRKCDLTGLDCLEEMHLDGNKSLDTVSLSNKRLRYLDLSDCALRSLDVSRCPVLNVLVASGNPLLEFIYVSKDQAISTITKDTHTTIKYVD